MYSMQEDFEFRKGGVGNLRMHNMVGCVRDITEGKGSNFFLMVDHASLAAHNPLEVELMTGKGERVRLTD